MIKDLVRLALHSFFKLGFDRIDHRRNCVFINVRDQPAVFIGFQVFDGQAVPEFIDLFTKVDDCPVPFSGGSILRLCNI
jgi:hypothetical protein